MQIAGKTAIITGAGGALGSAICNHLLENGAKAIIAIDNNEEALRAFISPKIHSLCCDLTNFSALEKQLLPVLSAHPDIEIVINNAGILHSAPLANFINKDSERFAKAAVDWRQVLDVNLSSAFYVTQLVADHMLRRRSKGIIINMSSISAKGTAGQSAYAASKAGINALTQVWAKELSPMGIRSVAIAPGYIDTPSTRKAVSDAQLEAIKNRVPLGHLGEIDHILQAVMFAITNDYVNGTILEIDGGLLV